MKDLTTEKPSTSLDYVTILGVKINSAPKSELLKLISKKIEKKIQFYLVTPNPEIVLQAQKDKELSDSLNSADFSIPDGFGLVLAAKFLHGANISVIKGREFMLDLIKIASEKNLKIFLLGGKPGVAAKAAAKLKIENWKLKIEHSDGPWLNNEGEPISQVDSLKQIDVIKKINTFKPDILFTAFGAPKQEKWITKNISKLNITGVMTVGGSFDTLSGKSKLPPAILERIGLEWLWRLIQEPKRIKRMINAVIIFPILVIKSKIGH